MKAYYWFTRAVFGLHQSGRQMYDFGPSTFEYYIRRKAGLWNKLFGQDERVYRARA